MSLSLIRHPIHKALCHIWEKKRKLLYTMQISPSDIHQRLLNVWGAQYGGGQAVVWVVKSWNKEHLDQIICKNWVDERGITWTTFSWQRHSNRCFEKLSTLHRCRFIWAWNAGYQSVLAKIHIHGFVEKYFVAYKLLFPIDFVPYICCGGTHIITVIVVGIGIGHSSSNNNQFCFHFSER